MASDSDKIIINKLFIAVPDAFFTKQFTRYLRRRGLIDEQAYRNYAQMQRDVKRIAAINQKIKGQSFFQRLLTIAPELITRRSIGWFEDTGFISKHDANIYRLVLRTSKLAEGGLPTSFKDLARRAKYLLSSPYVDDVMELMVTSEILTKKESSRIKAAVLGGEIGVETLQKVLRAKTFLDFLQLAGTGLVGPKTVRALKLAGLLDNRTAEALLSAMSYGNALWTVFEGSRRADGLAARMAYVASGSLSWELVDFVNVVAPKRIKPIHKGLLKVAVSVSQEYNRHLMEQMTDRKFRVVPGESPIVTYFRASKETDSAILRMLAEAADDARRHAEALAGAPRGAEYTLRANALHQSMRQIWDGTGYLTIRGEEQVSNAAIEAAEDLNRIYSKHADPFIQNMLQYQARSGLDSYISRRENTLPLARRVYGNLNLWTNKVDKEVSKSLLTGESATEMAARVSKLINPSVMGGVKYASMRLARTEISNAFHQTTIRHTREMPWVKGYKWNKSSSHRHGDICDQYAEDDHDNMGQGVFKKTNVPDKPHPQCMCYITTVGIDEKGFIKAFNAGRYDSYMNSRAHDPGVVDTMMTRLTTSIAQEAGQVAGSLAWSRGLPALGNMIASSEIGNRGFNPVAVSMAMQKEPGVGAKLAAAMQKNPIVSSMVEDLNHSRIDAGPITATEEKNMAAALAGFEKRLGGAEGDLLKRHNSFIDLDRKIQSYVTRGITGAKEWQNNLYNTIIGHDSNVRFTDPDIVSLSLYGQSSYRKMNTALRASRGALNKVDAKFKDFNKMFEDLDDLDPSDPNHKNNVWDILQTYGSKMGYEPDDIIHPGPDSPDDALFLGAMNNILNDYPQGRPFSMGGMRSMSDVVTQIDKRMEPSTKDGFLYRITGPEFYGLGGRMPEKSDIGHIFSDDAYVSTEGVQNYFNGKGAIEEELGLSLAKRPTRIKMFVPEGTMMTRVNDFENELLMGRGSRFQILDVIDEDPKAAHGFAKTINLALIGQDQDIYKRAKTMDEEDMWDAIMGDF